jgi:hypothetical protein
MDKLYEVNAMEQLLYYPGFEIHDELWLKFALLSLENVNTIVPYEADEDLSDMYKSIFTETDLLKKYRPTGEEPYIASINTIEEIEKYLRKPERYFSLLGKVNIREFWQNPVNQCFELYGRKFHYNFEYFCEENKFCRYTENGIVVPELLGLMYMRNLAYTISNKTKISVIADKEEEQKIRKIANEQYRTLRSNKFIECIQNLIKMELPFNLDEIPFSNIIKLRNKDSFKKKLTAFHESLNELNSIHNINFSISSYREIREKLEYTKADLRSDILGLASTTAIVSLGINIAISNDANTIEFVKELMGLGLVGAGVYNLHDKYRQKKNKIMTNRYFSDLRKLNRY